MLSYIKSLQTLLLTLSRSSATITVAHTSISTTTSSKLTLAKQMPTILASTPLSSFLVAPSTMYKTILKTTFKIKVTSSIKPTPAVTLSVTQQVLHAPTSTSSIATTDDATNNALSAQLTSATLLLINTLDNLTDFEVVGLEFSKVNKNTIMY